MVDLRTVLLVEDDPNDAELTLEALKEPLLANQIVWVEDGGAALDYMHRRGRYADRPAGAPCLVLLDLKLPRVSGIEFLKEVKGHPDFRTVPVVALTSSREERDLTECYRLGVNGYVVKPVDFASFLRVVREIGLFWAVVNEPPPRQPSSG